MLMATDHHGEVVWFYRTNARISDFDILPDGNISYMTHNNKIIVIDWLGKKNKSWYANDRPQGGSDKAIPVDALTMHHDVTLLPNGNILAAYGALFSRKYPEETNWKNRAQFPQWTMIREYKHTNPPEIIWELQLTSHPGDEDIGWTIFGAERFGFQSHF